jgi:hypothetical protein
MINEGTSNIAMMLNIHKTYNNRWDTAMQEIKILEKLSRHHLSKIEVSAPGLTPGIKPPLL